MKHLIPLLLFPLLAACSGEDRSGEQPFAPTVRTITALADADSCIVTGEVLASPNSRLTGRGFQWGNDTLRSQTSSPDADGSLFSDTLRALKAGRYYVVAYAKNGVGTGYGDTLRFTVP